MTHEEAAAIVADLSLPNPFFDDAVPMPLEAACPSPPSFEPGGRYLCETCYDALTNDLCPAALSQSGMEEAECAVCAARRLHPGTEG